MAENNIVTKEEVVTPENVVTPTNTAEVTAELKALSKKEALRELSKELGINAFEPNEIKAKFEELKTWQDSQKSEQEKLQETLESYKAKENEWQTKLLTYESKLKASELGIHPDNMEDALKLAGNDPEKLAEVVKKYPMFKAKDGIKIGVTNPHNNKQPTDLSEVEAYMASDPKYQAYLRRNKK